MNKTILFLVFCFFLEFSTSSSQTYKWTETHPPGDGRFYINNIEFDKIDEIKVFDMLGNHIKSLDINFLNDSNILDLSSYSNAIKFELS